MTFFDTFLAVVVAVFGLRILAMITQRIIYRDAFRVIRESNKAAGPEHSKLRWCYRTRSPVAVTSGFGQLPVWYFSLVETIKDTAK